MDKKKEVLVNNWTVRGGICGFLFGALAVWGVRLGFHFPNANYIGSFLLMILTWGFFWAFPGFLIGFVLRKNRNEKAKKYFLLIMPMGILICYWKASNLGNTAIVVANQIPFFIYGLTYLTGKDTIFLKIIGILLLIVTVVFPWDMNLGLGEFFVAPQLLPFFICFFISFIGLLMNWIFSSNRVPKPIKSDLDKLEK
jgi:hypothetical protein